MTDLIFTSRGLLPVDALAFTTGEVENENEHTTWEEWRAADGEVVKRNVHVRLKKGHDFMIDQGAIG
jgi:hypothetical protein